MKPMETKHTPGPWHITSNSSNKPIIIYDEAGWAIADCRTFHGRHDFGVAEANARLIAKAPLLEEAREVIASFLRAPSNGSSGPGSISIEVQDFNLRAARALLAKLEEK